MNLKRLALESRAAASISGVGTASKAITRGWRTIVAVRPSDAHNLLNNGVRSAELHRLMRNLLGMVPVETTPQRSCDGHNGNRSENSF